MRGTDLEGGLREADKEREGKRFRWEGWEYSVKGR